MDNKEDLVIITSCYPYAGGEQFLYREFKELEQYYKRIIIFPLSKSGEYQVQLGENIIVDDALQTSDHIRKSNSTNNVGLKLKLVFTELISNEKSFNQLSDLKRNWSYIGQNLNRLKLFEERIKAHKISVHSDFYSTWMNEGAMMLSLAKIKGVVSNFIFRVNGYDIFSERFQKGYIPFRMTCIKYASKVVVLSNSGKSYLEKFKIDHAKLVRNYSGIECDGQLSPEVTSKDQLNLVSCSGIIPLKRVDLLAQVLAESDREISWTHFGDGPDKEKVLQIIKQGSGKLKADFKGNVSHDTIMDFYANQEIHAFVHLSETEGLGMALIEAQNFGIPIIACNVGGVPEIVNDKTGILIEEKCTIKDIMEALDKILDTKYQSRQARVEIKAYCAQNFNVKENVKSLIKLF